MRRKMRLLVLCLILGMATQCPSVFQSGRAYAQTPASPLMDEIESLLAMDDERLIDTIQRRAFDYFWLETNPENGLIRDRSTPTSPSSIAAVGFGLSALPIGIERGWIGAEDGYQRALTTLRTFAEGGVEGYRGFYYHFVDMRTGRRVWESELSSIDTALLIAGALTVGEYFKGTAVADLAEQLYRQVDWAWMRAGLATVSMGWKPESGFLPHHWTHFDEGLLLYVLAIGAPEHSIHPRTWEVIVRPRQDGVIAAPGGVLFVYQYPLAWLDLRYVRDQYANYWKNAQLAAERNRAFTQELADQYRGYTGDVWGLSASDGPFGYRAYGAQSGNHDGTIAPYASVASMPLVPDLAMASVRDMLSTYGPLVWGKYGFVSAFNADLGWFSNEHIGIDQGITLLMLENHRTGLIWKLLMGNEHIGRAMELIGFSDDTSDQQGAVVGTPVSRDSRGSMRREFRVAFVSPRHT